jgi:DNA uptake protein ComE-like DNA-binding protein
MSKMLLGAAAAVLLGLAGLAGPAMAKSPAPAASSQAPHSSADAKGADAKGSSGTSTPATAPIDINSASRDELKTLPGIGDARADAIIKNRPYRGKNELADKKIVPQNVYNDIKDRIIAHRKS